MVHPLIMHHCVTRLVVERCECARAVGASSRHTGVAWLIAVATLYAGALAGSKCARIGCARHRRTQRRRGLRRRRSPHRAVAAGPTAAVWLVLSLLAYISAKRAPRCSISSPSVWPFAARAATR